MNHNNTSSEPVCIIVLRKEDLILIRAALKVIFDFLTGVFGHRSGAKNLIAVFLLILQFPVHLVEDLSGVGKSSAYKLRRKIFAGLSADELGKVICASGKQGRPAKLTAEQKQDVYDSIESKNYFGLFNGNAVIG